jgi:hypothetical protein
MSTLREAIKSETFAGLTDAQAAAAMVEVVALPDNPTRYSYQGVAETLGQAVAAATLDFLDTASTPVDGDDAETRIQKRLLRAELASFEIGSRNGETGGLDFSRPERQSQIDAWIDASEDSPQVVAVLTALKRLGKPIGPRWQSLGLTAAPSEAEIVAARAENTRVDTIADWQVRFDAALNQYGTSEQSDGVAAVEAIAAEMEAE